MQKHQQCMTNDSKKSSFHLALLPTKEFVECFLPKTRKTLRTKIIKAILLNKEYDSSISSNTISTTNVATNDGIPACNTNSDIIIKKPLRSCLKKCDCCEGQDEYTPRSRRTISFHNQIAVMVYPSAISKLHKKNDNDNDNNNNDDAINKLWYQKQDYNEMKLERDLLLIQSIKDDIKSIGISTSIIKAQKEKRQRQRRCYQTALTSKITINDVACCETTRIVNQ